MCVTDFRVEFVVVGGKGVVYRGVVFVADDVCIYLSLFLSERLCVYCVCVCTCVYCVCVRVCPHRTTEELSDLLPETAGNNTHTRTIYQEVSFTIRTGLTVNCCCLRCKIEHTATPIVKINQSH